MEEEKQKSENKEQTKEKIKTEIAKPVKAAKKPAAHAPEKKVKEVKELAEELKKYKTLMIISIKGVPSPQLQKIKKELRGKATVKIIKKNIMLRAIDEAKIPEMQELKEHVQADCALGLSDDDAFELAGWLAENRSPVSAKEGQEVTEDIKIEPGPTDLMPGPDISALGNVGLKVAVEQGKISIKAPHTILKVGDKVTSDIAAVLQKLDIKPFMVGLNPAVIYDSVAKKVYVGVKIDKDQALSDLITAKTKALGLAQSLGIITKDTIGYLLAKANAEMQALEKLAPAEEEKPAEPEEKKGVVEEKSEEEEKPAEEEKKEEAKEEPKEETKDEQ